jgi:hypothetical protein
VGTFANGNPVWLAFAINIETDLHVSLDSISKRRSRVRRDHRVQRHTLTVETRQVDDLWLQRGNRSGAKNEQQQDMLHRSVPG